MESTRDAAAWWPRPLRAKLGQREKEQYRQCADSDVNPLLAGETSSFDLIEILRERAKLFVRKACQARIDRFTIEPMRGESVRHTVDGDDFPNRRQIARARVEALVGCRLRGHLTSESRKRCND